MLTILQKQSKQLEIELKNKKQLLLETRTSLEEKSARVEELEAQLLALTPSPETEEEQKSIVDEERVKELTALVEALGKQLKESDGKMTYEQLRANARFRD